MFCDTFSLLAREMLDLGHIPKSSLYNLCVYMYI